LRDPLEDVLVALASWTRLFPPAVPMEIEREDLIEGSEQ
jgi:hypothetical protein